MFTINGETWYIYFVPYYHDALLTTSGDYSIGCCDDNRKTIYINEELYGNFLRKVLCHEIVHSAMFSYNVDLSIEQEELLADLVATYGQEIINITNNVFTKLKERD